MAITSSFLFSKEKSLPTASCKTPPDSNPQNTTLDNSSAITVQYPSLLASFRLAFRSHVFLVNHASDVPLPSHPAPWRSSPITTTSSISRAVCCCARLRLSSVLETQRLALAAHASQQAWLDAFQGAVAFVDVLGTMSRAVGKMSGAFEHARGSSDREFPA